MKHNFYSFMPGIHLHPEGEGGGSGGDGGSGGAGGEGGEGGAGGSGGDEGNERTFKQAEVDRIVQDRLARDRAKFADYDDLKKKAEEFDKLQDEQKTELEKERERAAKAEQERDSVLAEAKETRLRAALLAEAAKADRKVVDAEAVIALLDRSSLELDADGNPKNAKEAVDSLLEQRPYLVAGNGGARPGGADQGARGGGEQQLTRDALKTMKPEEIEKARQEGRLDQLLKGET